MMTPREQQDIVKFLFAEVQTLKKKVEELEKSSKQVKPKPKATTRRSHEG